MNSSAAEFLASLAQSLESRASGLTIDADTHATDLGTLAPAIRARYDSANGVYYHGRPLAAEELIAEMDLAGVDTAIIWQNPAATGYPGAEEANFEALLAANRYIADSARRHFPRFIPGGWVDPKALGVERALELTRIAVVELGFPIVKLNPAQNRYPIDSEPVVRVVDRIVELGAVPAFHYGADSPYTPAAGLEKIAARHPGRPILAIHMGGGGAGYVEAESLYHESRALGLRRPNLCFALSARRDTHTESDLVTYQRAGAPFKHNLFCASDAPYGRMSWNFGGYRLMLETLRETAGFTTEDIRGFLGANCARFAAAACRRVLEVHHAKTRTLPCR